MTDLHGRIVGNTIVLDTPPNLPDGQKVRVHIETLPPPERKPRKAGVVKGKVTMSDDFNDTPPGFEDYMP